MKEYNKYAPLKRPEEIFSELNKEIEKEEEPSTSSISSVWEVILKIPTIIDSDLEKTIKDSDLSYIREADKKAVYLNKNKQLIIDGYKIVLETKSKKDIVLGIESARGLILGYLKNFDTNITDDFYFGTNHLAAALCKIYDKMSEMMNESGVKFNLLMTDGNEIELDAEEVKNLSGFFRNVVKDIK